MFSLLSRNLKALAPLRRAFSTHQTHQASNLTQSNGEFKSTLVSKRQLTHDSYIFRFDLPNKDLPLGLLPGQHVKIHLKQTKAKKDSEKVKEKEISRKYTPVSDLLQKGVFDMLIKIYEPNEFYPEGGEMSQLLKKLQIGDHVEVSGPSGRTIYQGKGNFQLEGTKVKVTDVGFVIGGSGITPAYQIMQEIYKDKEDKTRAHLLFANRAEDEILLKDELDEMAKDERFNFQYTIDKAKTADWKGFQGYINKEMMQKVFPAPSNNILMTFCGNKPMRKLVFGLFEELKYNEDLTARF